MRAFIFTNVQKPLYVRPLKDSQNAQAGKQT